VGRMQAGEPREVEAETERRAGEKGEGETDNCLRGHTAVRNATQPWCAACVAKNKH